jgi:hypothetical protein
LPAPIVQIPEQQSLAAAQRSPFWTQNDDARWHVPAAQRCEQQSLSAVQAFPDVSHVVLSAAHFPVASHWPLQQLALDVHAAPSETHAAVEQ